MDFLRRSFILYIFGTYLLNCGLLYAGISVSPATLELLISAGESYKGAYTVTNDSDEPVRVKVEMEDWIKAKTGKDTLPPEVWVSMTPNEFGLEGRASRDIEFIVNPPRGSEDEFVAMVFFGTTSNAGAVNLMGRIGCSIYAAIKDTMRLGCLIKNVTGRKSTIKLDEGLEEDKGILFFVDVENTGNVHIRPTGEITVTDDKGDVYRVAIERSFPVYPGQHEVYPVLWKKSAIMPGAYTAGILLDYGNIYKVDKKLEKSVTFTVNNDGTVSF